MYNSNYTLNFNKINKNKNIKINFQIIKFKIILYYI